MSFALVKYTDGQSGPAPVSFIKDFNAANHTKEKVYEVFWSNDPDDTPSIIFERNGDVHNIDELIRKSTAKEKDEARYKNEAGYYFCTVLATKETEEEVRKLAESKGGLRLRHARSNVPVVQAEEKRPVRKRSKKKERERLIKSGSSLSMKRVLNEAEDVNPKRKRVGPEQEGEFDLMDPLDFPEGDNGEASESEVDDEDSDPNFDPNDEVSSKVKKLYDFSEEASDMVLQLDDEPETCENSANPCDHSGKEGGMASESEDVPSNDSLGLTSSLGEGRDSPPKSKDGPSTHKTGSSISLEEGGGMNSQSEDGSFSDLGESVFPSTEKEGSVVSNSMCEFEELGDTCTNANGELQNRISELESKLAVYESLSMDDFRLNYLALEKKYGDLEKKYVQSVRDKEKLQEKFDKLFDQFQEVVAANLKLQNLVIKVPSKGKTSHSGSISMTSTSSMSSSPPPMSCSTPFSTSNTQESQDFQNESVFNTSVNFPGAASSMSQLENVNGLNDSGNVRMSANHAPSRKISTIRELMAKNFTGNENYKILSPKELKDISSKADKEKGVKEDTIFVRGITGKVFDPEVLAVSSVTGKGVDTGTKKHTEKQKLDEEGVEYIKYLFAHRLDAKQDCRLSTDVRDSEIAPRLAKTILIMGEKIRDTRKTCRGKQKK